MRSKRCNKIAGRRLMGRNGPYVSFTVTMPFSFVLEGKYTYRKYNLVGHVLERDSNIATVGRQEGRECSQAMVSYVVQTERISIRVSIRSRELKNSDENSNLNAGRKITA